MQGGHGVNTKARHSHNQVVESRVEENHLPHEVKGHKNKPNELH